MVPSKKEYLIMCVDGLRRGLIETKPPKPSINQNYNQSCSLGKRREISLHLPTCHVTLLASQVLKAPTSGHQCVVSVDHEDRLSSVAPLE